MRYAVINGAGVVVNVIEWNGTDDYTPGAGLTLVQSDVAGIGATYDVETGVFSAPPAPVSEE